MTKLKQVIINLKKPTLIKYFYVAIVVIVFSVIFIDNIGFKTLANIINKPNLTATAQGLNMSDDQALAQAFMPIQKSSNLPVVNRYLSDIYSAFGPRIKTSSGGRYDWHRGIDIGDVKGEQIINTYEGEFDSIKQFVDGGTTVVIKHTFPTPLIFKGKTLPYFYTFYMHLSQVDPVLVAAFLKKEHPKLSAGTKIGLLGSTGTTEKNNLHMEVRVGTQCSLEFQLNNPKSSCTKGYGFEPSVNPMLMFKPLSTDFTITKSININKDFVIFYTAPDTSLYFNKVEYQLLNNPSSKTIKSHILNFDTKEGFNASSTKSLDTQDKSKPYIQPIIFNNQAKEFKTNIIIPYSYWKNSGATMSAIFVTDIWGNKKSLSWNN